VKEPPDRDSIRASYDRLAAEYSVRIFDELDGKPIDRGLLDEIAARANGPVCDLGCGPGHAARYLSEHGAAVCGMDLSPAMIAEARRLNPDLDFEVADMRSLPFADRSLGAAVALYSLIHFEDGDLSTACKEIARVLIPDGLLLASFHRGSTTTHLDELWGKVIDLDFHFFEPEQIEDVLTASGFAVERLIEREPYKGVEVETRRFYIVASNAADPKRSIAHDQTC
jgi:SAM-dependent methyltransferase